MSFDFYTTFLAAAGAVIPSGADLSGANLLPFVTGEATSRRPHDLLFWMDGRHFAVRWGDCKLSNFYSKGSKDGVGVRGMISQSSALTSSATYWVNRCIPNVVRVHAHLRQRAAASAPSANAGTPWPRSGLPTLPFND